MSVGCWILPQPGQARLQAKSGSISTISGNFSRLGELLAHQVGADAHVLAQGDGHQRTSAGSENWTSSSATRRSSTATGTEAGEAVDDAVDEMLGRRRAGGDADGAGAGQPRQVELGLVLDEVRRARRSRRATSTSRLEFDELGEPTTSTRSHSAAMARTASWRFWVA